MTPLEAMAKAMRETPDFWMRVNKLREDARYFEVGHNLVSEDFEPVVVSAFSDHIDATLEVGRLTWKARARAALLALAEAELPEEALEASADACCAAREESIETQIAFRERSGLPQLEKYGVAPAEWLPPTFRAICRAIAEEGTGK